MQCVLLSVPSRPRQSKTQITGAGAFPRQSLRRRRHHLARTIKRQAPPGASCQDPCPFKARLPLSHRKALGALLGQGSGSLSWRATDFAKVTREALGHHLEACFKAHFPQEGARRGGPNPQEFISEIIQELQESRVMSGCRRLPVVAPHPGEDVSCASALTYQGSTEPPLRSASGPRKWGAAKVHPTATFACLMACRTWLPRTSAS